jgi:pimeloyl-ACP methyl ester carboxylesterase
LLHRTLGTPQLRYRCIFLEARGCNASADAPGPFTIQQQAMDVTALLDQLQVPQATFCGHSMGGGVGWELLVRQGQGQAHGRTSPAAAPARAPAGCTRRFHRAVLLAPVPARGFMHAPATMQQPRNHPAKHYGWLPQYTDRAEAFARLCPFFRFEGGIARHVYHRKGDTWVV